MQLVVGIPNSKFEFFSFFVFFVLFVVVFGIAEKISPPT
jgi:hypothetical protein